MDQETIELFLGRSLSEIEVTNIDLYLDIANNMLSRILCTTLEAKTESRYFDARDGFRTLFVDIFTKINSISVDGVELTEYDYILKQNDNRNASWYNSIVLVDEMTLGTEVIVNADWGFETLPVELQDLTARLFDLVSKRNDTDTRVSGKKIEDFSISYKDITPDDQLLSDYSQVISKYSQCHLMGGVRHGHI